MTIIDWYSHKIVAWRLSKSLELSLFTPIRSYTATKRKESMRMANRMHLVF